jgi:hypothetical protein
MDDFTEYEPGSFGTGGNLQFAQEAWAFLNQPPIVEAMIAATELGHPAVVGIRQQLVERFGELMNIERNRQQIGHMAKQVLAKHGYEIAQAEVKVNAYPFTKAARYRHRDRFMLHVFRASSDPRELCITSTRSTEGFPEAPDGGRWRYWMAFNSKLQGKVGFGIDTDDARAKIKEAGFVRHRLERLLRAATRG